MSEEVKGELIVLDQSQAIVRAASGDVAEALEEYRKIQRTFDRQMPDCLATIQGKQFRKKAYWRGIATAFNLTVMLKTEERIEEDDDWGWLVTYTATAGNGRSADGDGSCFASEKTDRQGNVIATVHNVRAHAHTRAYNRAVSNLVGFGEVSAEEMNDQPALARQTSQSQRRTDRPITQAQRGRLFKIRDVTAQRLQVPQKVIDGWIKSCLSDLGFKFSSQLTEVPYDQLCNKLQALSLTDLPEPSSAEDDGGPF